MATTSTTRRRARTALITSVALLGLVAGACSSEDLREGGIPEPATSLPSLTLAQVEGSTQQLDDIVGGVMEETGIPGVAVGVVFDDQVVITEGYGLREVGTDDEVDAETVFQMASLSKPVGATAIAGAVGDGTLTWDDTITTYLPDFQLSDPYVTENVTVADMYSHRSGLPGSFAGNDLEAMGYDQAEIVERLRYLPLNPFRATYEYSNFGMTVGGVAAATAAGTTYPDLVEERLLVPAGMTSTSASYADYLARDNKALIHAKVDGAYAAEFTRDPDAQAPAGGISSNVVDLSRWMRLQLNDGTLDGEQIIDGEALDETHRAHMNSRATTGDPSEPIREYGLGWDLSQSEADPALVQWAHSGAFTQGAGTTVRLLPQLGLGVIVLTNAAPVGGAEAIADAYIDTLLNGTVTQDWPAIWTERFAPITTPPEISVPADPVEAKEASAYVGTYENDYYGLVTITEQDGGLVMEWGPDATTLALEHYDGDVFLYVDSPEVQGAKTPLAFQFTDGAEASSLVLGNDTPLGPWMVLQRTS